MGRRSGGTCWPSQSPSSVLIIPSPSVSSINPFLFSLSLAKGLGTGFEATTRKDFPDKLVKIGRKWESQLGMHVWREPSRQKEEQEWRLRGPPGEDGSAVSTGKGRRTVGGGRWAAVSMSGEP